MHAIIFRSITIIVTYQKNRQQPEHLQTYLIIVGIYPLLLFRLLFIATRFSTFQCLGTAFTTLVKVLTWRHTGTPKSRALARKTDICLLVILKQGILLERCCSSQYHHEEKRTQHRHLDQRNLCKWNAGNGFFLTKLFCSGGIKFNCRRTLIWSLFQYNTTPNPVQAISGYWSAFDSRFGNKEEG